MGASKLKSAGQARSCSKNRYCSLESKCSLQAEFLPLLGTCLFSSGIQLTAWGPPCYWAICFARSLLIWMLITSKKIASQHHLDWCLNEQLPHSLFSSFQSLSHVWLCDPMDCDMPGFPVHHQLLKLAQLMYIESVIPSNHLILCHPLLSCLQSFPESGSFQMNQFFPSGGQSIGVSTSASALTMNIQDWSPLGWFGWISLQSRGLSRVFSNTTIQKHQFFNTQLSLKSNSHIHTWLLEKP